MVLVAAVEKDLFFFDVTSGTDQREAYATPITHLSHSLFLRF